MNTLHSVLDNGETENGLYAMDVSDNADRRGQIFPMDEVDEDYAVPVEQVVRLKEGYGVAAPNDRVALVYAVDADGDDTGEFEVRTFDGQVLGLVG